MVDIAGTHFWPKYNLYKTNVTHVLVYQSKRFWSYRSARRMNSLTYKMKTISIRSKQISIGMLDSGPMSSRSGDQRKPFKHTCSGHAWAALPNLAGHWGSWTHERSPVTALAVQLGCPKILHGQDNLQQVGNLTLKSYTLV